MSNDVEGQPASPHVIKLRMAIAKDKSDMLQVMHPYQNGYFPGKLHSKRVKIAEIDDEIVGFVGWEKDQVLALYVAEKWRGASTVGPALLDIAEAAICAGGHPRVRILIDADASRAHRFYVKHDYETDWDPNNDDIAWMTKDLL